MEVKRIPTGISGMDGLIGGGLEEGSVNLITGSTGTGKSIFSVQFLYNGASKYNERGLLITTEETAENIRKKAMKFGWDLGSLEKSGMIKILEIEPYDVERLVETVTQYVEGEKVKRVVIDSVSMFELYVHDPYKIRKSLYKLLHRMRDVGKTVLVVSETLEGSKSLSRFGVLEFMVDGVFLLQYVGITTHKRLLSIRKMRMTDHSTDIHPFEITNKGIVVHSI